MKVFCCLTVLVTHKPISFVFCYTSFVKRIPQLWKLAEEEGTGMGILQRAFIILRNVIPVVRVEVIYVKG